MNKIESAIETLHIMDNNSSINSLLCRIHPLPKLLIAIMYIILLTSINKYNLNQVLAMGIYLIIVSLIGNLSIKNCLKSLKLVFILLFLIGIANPILDRNIVTYIGGFPVTSGMISMITLFLKGFFSIICSYFLVSTTGIEGICYSFKLLHIPNIIITIFLLIYRYIIVFLKEFNRIWKSYSLRAPKQKGINYKAWGSLIGSSLIRSMDRAKNVYESMELRGFNPDRYFVKEQKMDKNSFIYFVLGVLLIITIRFIPIFNMIGNLLII